MIDWGRWLPGLSNDEPQDDSPVSRALGLLSPPSPVADAFDPDQGPREALPGSVGANGPQPAPIISPMAPAENPGVSYGAALPAPLTPEQEEHQAVLDRRRQFGAGVQGVGSTLQRGATGLYDAAQDSTNAVETVKRAARAGAEAYGENLVPPNPLAAKSPGQAALDALSATKAGILPGFDASQAAADAFGREIGQGIGRAAGTSTVPFADIPLVGPVSSEDVAGFIGQAALDPTNLVGAGEARTAARVARPAVRGAIRAGEEVAEEVPGFFRGMTGRLQEGIRGVRSSLPENRPRLPEGEMLLGSGVVPETGLPRAGWTPPPAIPDAEIVQLRRAAKLVEDGKPIPPDLPVITRPMPARERGAEPHVLHFFVTSAGEEVVLPPANRGTPGRGLNAAYNDYIAAQGGYRGRPSGRYQRPSGPTSVRELSFSGADPSIQTSLSEVQALLRTAGDGVPQLVSRYNDDGSLATMHVLGQDATGALIPDEHVAGYMNRLRDDLAAFGIAADAGPPQRVVARSFATEGDYARAIELHEQQLGLRPLPPPPRLAHAAADGGGAPAGTGPDRGGGQAAPSAPADGGRGLGPPRTPGAAAAELGSGFVSRFQPGPQGMADLRNASQGAVVGAAAPDLREQEGDAELTPTERLARIAGGAVLGFGAGRSMRGRGASAARSFRGLPVDRPPGGGHEPQATPSLRREWAAAKPGRPLGSGLVPDDVGAGRGPLPSVAPPSPKRSMETPTTELTYQGRTLSVTPTGDPAAPFTLKGARGGELTLVPMGSPGGRRYYVKTPSGNYGNGTVGQMMDGSLIWLPSSGKEAFAAEKIWKSERAARIAEEVAEDRRRFGTMGRSQPGGEAAPDEGEVQHLGSGFVPAAPRYRPELAQEPVLPGMEPPPRVRENLPEISDVPNRPPNLGDVPPSQIRQPALPGTEEPPPRPLGELMQDILGDPTSQAPVPAARGEGGQTALPTMGPGVMERLGRVLGPHWRRLGIVRMAGMLSDTAGHAQNIGGNLAGQLADLAETPLMVAQDIPRAAAARAVGGRAGRILGGPERSVFMTEVPARLAGQRAGARQGLGRALEIMKTGINPDEASKLDPGQRGFGTDIPGLAPKGSKVAGVVDAAVEAPLRALGAADAVFRGAAADGHLAAEALAEATRRNGGKKPSAEQIKAAMWDPDVRARVENLTDRSVLQEDRAATRWYRDNVVGKAPPGIKQGIEILTPWVKTPWNIMAQGLGMTDIGAAISVINDVARGKATARGVQRKVARAAIGTAIGTWAAGEYADGVITGPYPTDQAEASTLPPGWRPWSRKVEAPNGETYYVPLALLGQFAIPAVYHILWAEAKKKGLDTPELTQEVVMGIGRFAEQSTFLEGLGNISKILDERTGEANLNRLLESTVASYSPHVLGGGAFGREIQRLTGMPARDPEGGAEALRATFPYQDQAAALVGAEPVRPRQDVLGREESMGLGGPVGGVLRAGVENDAPVIAAYRSAGIGLPRAAPKKLTDPGTKDEYTLDADQRATWERAFGEAVQRRWDDSGNSDDPKALERVKTRAADDARKAVLGG